MNNLKVIILAIIISILINSCAGVNFLGAQKWIGGNHYVQRWYLNPQYSKDEIPKGTAFYGDAAEKIKDKFIIKYYMQDGKDSLTEIPLKDMWKVQHNGKNFHIQTDDNLFYYIKDTDGTFIKKEAIRFGTRGSAGVMVPIKECYTNGWCKLYRSYDFNGKLNETSYVKKSILYQGPTILNEKEIKDNILWTTKAITAPSPWITPTKEVCEKYEGEVNSRNVCGAKWKDAKKICKDSGGRLPTVDELRNVIIQCGGHTGGVEEYGTREDYENFRYNVSYTSCYRKKGFAYEANGYYSATLPNDNDYVEMVYVSSGSANGISIKDYPFSFLCIEQ